MARLGKHLRRGVVVAAATLVTGLLPAVAAGAADTPASSGTSPIAFYTPVDGDTVRLSSGTAHVLLGADDPAVSSVTLAYSADGGSKWQTAGTDERESGSDLFDITWTNAPTGPVMLEATGYTQNDTAVGSPVRETVTLSETSGTRFTFIRPAEGTPLGVFRRADGHTFTRTSGWTTGTTKPSADAPTVTPVAVPASALPAPTGTIDATADKDGRRIFRVPVELTGNPGLDSGHAVIRVRDGISSAAVETPLYTQTVRSVTSTSTPVAGTANVTITVRVTDQNGLPVVGAPVHLRGYVNGSRTPVSQVAVTDAYDGLATFANGGSGFPAGFYVPYVDLNLNGFQTTGEPAGPQVIVGTVTRAAPGRALYHNNVRTKGGSGTVGDSLRGTRNAAARHYPWIDQDGQLAYTSRAVLRGGVGRVSQPAHLTWVNAHGSPFNPRWLKKGRFETRAWSALRKRRGLRNADTTFKQNAAYGISVEWEVKNIRPFTKPAALNAAFANLAAAAQRYYGSSWQSRVQVKMLSNLPGGPAFALRVLKVAHNHGFTTIYLARGNATKTQIPAWAHAYVTYVRGAKAGLYATAG